MKKIKDQARQGDVLVHPITVGIAGQKLKTLPADAVRVESKEAIVLAYGEVTGHSHKIEEIDKVALYQTPAGRRFLVLDGEFVELNHEEHGTVDIAPGTPRDVLIQEEYERGAMRQVLD